jgi:hypothetical protein
MQQTSLRSPVHYHVAVLVLISACVLFACSGGTGQRRNISATVPLNSNNVTALEGSFPAQFTIPDGTVFSPDSSPDICQKVTVLSGICGNPVAFTFVLSSGTTTTLFTLNRFGSAAFATGGVTFGSCTLTVTASTFLAGQGPQTGDTITFSTCNLVVSASNVEVGGGTETGIVTLMLTNATTGVSAASTPITLMSSVSIQTDGFLLLNGVNTGIDTDITGTIPK